jgi:hypothetical protein
VDEPGPTNQIQAQGVDRFGKAKRMTDVASKACLRAPAGLMNKVHDRARTSSRESDVEGAKQRTLSGHGLGDGAQCSTAFLAASRAGFQPLLSSSYLTFPSITSG